ncbi:MAG: transglutaminaseTgpA domain-containing protein [Campylobacterales bacterium]|nr:transglutaminaseTgpA domain-containing protein [Campylobacterales bacterium]
MIFIFKKEKSDKDKYLLMALGFILIALSFFSNYNFSNFSRIQFFVSLVSSLLIYAVTLQKLTGEMNIYLKISPALLMLLSFFFFESISMLLYSIFVLFVFVLLNIWSRMEVELIDVLKITSQLFILSLPAVVILFLFFPRISFEKADFGFRADNYSNSGYDGEMIVSSNEIILSNKPVMEVLFKDENISENSLYFRGSTLYTHDGLEWKKGFTTRAADRLVEGKNLINYDITLYPHGETWIYSLDIPTKAVQHTKLNNDYTLESKQPLYEKKRYTLQSALSYTLYSKDFSNALKVDNQKSEKTYEALKWLKALDAKDSKKAMLLLQFFKDQNLSYTLKPKGIDLEDFTDSFLFEAKNGYCVHFASAFAQSARMLGIPSRVVTGFKSGKENMIKNYLLVKQSDAHAWVELYLEDKGWVRFDPTATASKNSDVVQNTQNQGTFQNTIFQKINLNFMYVKYIIESWILDYNRLKQMAILDKLFNDTLYLLKFILSLLGLVLATFLIYITIKSAPCKDEIMCEMSKLLKILHEFHLVKKENETMQAFLKRAEEKLDISFLEISYIYHTLKYAKSDKVLNLKRLAVEIKKAKRLILAITQ